MGAWKEALVSKHISAEQKLQVSTRLKPSKRVSEPKLKHQTSEPPGPPIGTNSKNQFR